MEAVRIIKEMRNATRQLPVCGADDDRRVYPRIAIWENVVGAYSSNNGEDFRCVLEELARIENPEVSIPKPKKWSNAGCVELPHGCITWRTHDAQYFGVPQRRRRISLVVDFRDEPRPEIQFIPEGLSRNTEQSSEEREAASEDIRGSVDKAISFQERAGKPGGGKGILIQSDHVGALSTLNNQAVVYSLGHDIRSARLTDDEITDPLTATDYKDPIKINDCRQTYLSVVRKLTPLECERLQGYPDGWTDIGEWTDSKGKKHKEADSPRYKALGNSIALPYWEWLAKKVATSLGDSDLTMGSLFSGIGGFELVFQRAGVRPIWASEVEEFCIAVTKLHFPENKDAKKE